MELASRTYPIGGSNDSIEISLSHPYKFEEHYRCDVHIRDGEEQFDMKGIAGVDELQAIQLSLFLMQSELDQLKKKYGESLELGGHRFTIEKA